jgi:hypothetical protein
MQRLKPSDVAHAIAVECETTIEDFNAKIIADEEPMTDRLFGSISNALDGRKISGLQWKARTLRTGRDKAAEEKRHGADILGVLSIDLRDFKVRKGFLIQAKLIEPDKLSSEPEWLRFQGQCRTMLNRTRDAFAVIYSRQCGIRFIPASLILDIGRKQVFDVGWRTLFGFFKSHVKCEIGDRRLNSPTIDMLDSLPDVRRPVDAAYGAPLVLAMEVSDESGRS